MTMLGGVKKHVVWRLMWHQHRQARRRGSGALSVATEHSATMAVYDAVRNRTDTNVNTHRAVYLPQAENGVIGVEQLLARLRSRKRLSIEGELATQDGRPGIASGTVRSGRLEYEIVFADLPFYAEPCEELFVAGGIMTERLTITDARTLHGNLLCAAGLEIAEGAELEVHEGATVVFSDAVVRGTLKGYLTGVLEVVERGTVNGTLLAGELSLSDAPTLIGMYYGDQIRIDDGATVRLKEFGSMTNAIEAGSGVTLEFEDAEPLVLTMNTNEWRINVGGIAEDSQFAAANTTGSSWYLTAERAPTDLLGRSWGPEAIAGGVMMPSMSNIGVMKLEKDLRLVAVEGTEHNYALLMMNRHPITCIEGAIHVHVIEGIACPPKDIAALEVSAVTGDGSPQSPYVVGYRKIDKGYDFESAEEIAVQAATKPALTARFADLDQFGWQFGFNRVAGTFAWYGYAKGGAAEHWDGPNGSESHVVRILRQ